MWLKPSFRLLVKCEFGYGEAFGYVYCDMFCFCLLVAFVFAYLFFMFESLHFSVFVFSSQMCRNISCGFDVSRKKEHMGERTCG